MRKAGKPLVFLLSLVPAAWLVYLLLTNSLGVNPAETLQLETGIWALRFLLAGLAITPLRRLTRWNRLVQYRRMIGLFAFFYAFLHFLSYLVLDQYFALDQMMVDVFKRPFITMGFIAFVVMIPLALTSTKGWIRRLGRRWQAVHRLVYVAAIAGVVHYVWKVKVPLGPPLYYAAALTLLLGFRIVWHYRAAKSMATQPVKG